jgi:hypothetical protein
MVRQFIWVFKLCRYISGNTYNHKPSNIDHPHNVNNR